jgi:hypothetical protein
MRPTPVASRFWLTAQKSRSEAQNRNLVSRLSARWCVAKEGDLTTLGGRPICCEALATLAVAGRCKVTGPEDCVLGGFMPGPPTARKYGGGENWLVHLDVD